MQRGHSLKSVTILALAAAFALSACASEPEAVPVAKWSKPGGDQAAFVSVHDQCVKDVQAGSASFFVAGERYPGTNGAVAEFVDDIGADFGFEDPAPGRGIDQDMFHRCMNSHGWSLDQNGFGAPPGDEVPMGP